MGSLWFAVEVTRVRPGGRWVYPGALGSLGFAVGVVGSVVRFTLVPLGVVGFIRGLLVHLRSIWGSLFSSTDIGFTGVCPGGRWIHPGTLGSLGFSLVIVEFIRGHRVHSGSHCGSFGSSRVVGLTRISPGGRWVHPRSFGSLGFALWVAGFIWRHWVHSYSP